MKRPLPPTYFFGSIIAMTEAFIKPEERMLEKAFGDRFRQYRARVRRWL